MLGTSYVVRRRVARAATATIAGRPPQSTCAAESVIALAQRGCSAAMNSFGVPADA
jgi:hypothetical protein